MSSPFVFCQIGIIKALLWSREKKLVSVNVFFGVNVCSVVLSFFVNEALRHESFVMCTVTTSKCSQGAASDTKRLREGLRQRAKRDSKFDPKNKSSRDAHSATTQRDKSLSYRLYPYGHHTWRWPLGAPALGYQLSPHRRVLLSLPTTGVCHFRNRASISRSSTCSSLISHLSSLISQSIISDHRNLSHLPSCALAPLL